MNYLKYQKKLMEVLRKNIKKIYGSCTQKYLQTYPNFCLQIK